MKRKKNENKKKTCESISIWHFTRSYPWSFDTTACRVDNPLLLNFFIKQKSLSGTKITSNSNLRGEKNLSAKFTSLHSTGDTWLVRTENEPSTHPVRRPEDAVNAGDLVDQRQGETERVDGRRPLRLRHVGRVLERVRVVHVLYAARERHFRGAVRDTP